MFQASNKINYINHPISIFEFAMGKKNNLHRAIILKSAKYLFDNDTNLEQWKTALNELEQNDLIPTSNNEFNIPVGNNLNTTFGKWIYCVVRVTKPEFMIETGVAHGYSSWIILNAMKKNKKGKLYSVDLPNNDTNAAYNFQKVTPQTGWLVPDELKMQWELHLGDAYQLLPQLINKLNKIDIFFHDSDHSYEHMKFEFNTMYPAIKSGGIILSDDVHKNASFTEFTSQHQLKALRFNKGGCAIIK